MSSITCLVGVSMIIIKPGTEVWGSSKFHVGSGPVASGLVYVPSGNDLKECFEVIVRGRQSAPHPIFAAYQEDQLLIKEEWVEFWFSHMGESSGEYISPMQWLQEGAGADDVFMEDDLAALYTIGKELLKENESQVNFVTVWTYGSRGRLS